MSKSLVIKASVRWMEGVMGEVKVITFICPKCGERHYAYYREGSKTLNYELGEFGVYGYTSENKCDLKEYEFLF